MIAEHGETALDGNLVYLRFPTPDEAKQFFDALAVQNKSLEGRVITFTFSRKAAAAVFHKALIKKFGGPT